MKKISQAVGRGWIRKAWKKGGRTWNKKASDEESRSGKREVEREEEKTVVQSNCVKPFTCDVSGSLGDSCSDFCRDSCGFSGCVCLRCRRVCLL